MGPVGQNQSDNVMFCRVCQASAASVEAQHAPGTKSVILDCFVVIMRFVQLYEWPFKKTKTNKRLLGFGSL